MVAPAPLKPSMIKYFASKQGFAGRDLDIAVAVALAESGGRQQAHNNNPLTGDDSYGLWQINMIGKMGADRRKQFGIPTNETLFDPNVNAKAAFLVWKQQGWKGWTTYTRGTYKKYLPDAEKATPVNNVGRTPAEEAAAIAAVDDSVVADPEAKAIFGAVNGLGANLFNAAAGVGGIIVAIALLVLGFVILARAPLKSGIKTIAGATPAGIAKKVVT